MYRSASASTSLDTFSLDDDPYFMCGLRWNDSEESMRQRELVGTSKGIDRENFIRERKDEYVTTYYQVDPVVIGEGRFGYVQRAVCLHTGNLRAIKTVEKYGRKYLEAVNYEVSIMKEMDHPNILKLYETFDTDRAYHLVTDLCEGGELFDRIASKGRLTENIACHIMRQILSTIAYIHSKDLVHRDIKAESFLFSENSEMSSLRLADFGESRCFQNTQYLVTRVGTPYYVAPEVISGGYNQASDDWSAGVILYILLSGRPPFDGLTDTDILQSITKKNVTFPKESWSDISFEAQELIKGLLQRNPKLRYSSYRALDHPWFGTYAPPSRTLPMPKSLVRNLKAFSSLSRLKRAALTVMAQYLREKDVKNLQSVFFILDPFHRGLLSLQEVVSGLHRMGLRDFPSDFLQVLEIVDSDGSGFIDYTEFIAAAANRSLFFKRKDVVYSAFRIFDLNGDGYITTDELVEVLGLDIGKGELGGQFLARQLIEEFDIDGDGELDYDEFYLMVKQTSDVDFEKKIPRVDWEAPLHGPRPLSELTLDRNAYHDGVVDIKPNVDCDNFDAVPIAY